MRKMAEGGKLTSKVILEALENNRGKVEEMYGKRIPLMSEGFARLRNEVEKTFGELMQDKETANAFASAMRGVGVALIGTIRAFAATVRFFARHQKVFLALLSAISIALLMLAYNAAAAWIALLGPIGLVIAGLVALALNWEDLVILFFAGFMKIGEGVDWLIDKIMSIPGVMRRLLNVVVRSFRSIGHAIGAAIRQAFDAVVRFITDKINWVIDKANWVIRQINRLPLVDLQTIDRVGGQATGASGTVQQFTPIQRSGGAPAVKSVSVGSMVFNVTSSDPIVAATETRKQVAAYFDQQLRTAQDAIG